VSFGAWEQTSATQAILTLPEIAWEASLGIYLIVTGFKPFSRPRLRIVHRGPVGGPVRLGYLPARRLADSSRATRAATAVHNARLYRDRR